MSNQCYIVEYSFLLSINITTILEKDCAHIKSDNGMYTIEIFSLTTPKPHANYSIPFIIPWDISFLLILCFIWHNVVTLNSSNTTFL